MIRMQFDTFEELREALLNPSIQPYREKVADLGFELGKVKDELAAAQSATRASLPDYALGGQLRGLEDALRHAMAGNKIACIKEVRQITGLGLKESKDLVERAGVQYRT